MQYYNINDKNQIVSFEEAVLQGIGNQKGLFFPEKIPTLPESFWENISDMEATEIAFQVMQPYVADSIPEKALRDIIEKTLTFPFPVVPITNNTFALELYHGPTLAFKDVGARFMANCLSYFGKQKKIKTNILVATSGDTGGAVGHSFLGNKDVTVYILYPSGKVSAIQELQLTTLGNNIKAIEVAGTFDDCQAIVKKSMEEEDFKAFNFTSANSINIARWLPQMIYYFVAYKAVAQTSKKIVVSCPSGNFGNICAGLLAKKMGLPISHFIAATNSNDTIPRFLKHKVYEPNPTVATISNAMDVSDPSNFIRIMELYEQQLSALQKDFSSVAYTDAQTLEIIQQVHQKYNYIMDPHGAISYLALEDYLQNDEDTIGIFLETAHPIKFQDIVEKNIQKELSIPKEVTSLFGKKKVSIPIQNYEAWKAFLLSE